MERPKLFGPDGKPVSYGLYPSIRVNANKFKPRPWTLGVNFRRAFSSYDRTELLNYSQQLYAQIGNLGTAINDKNFWAFGDGWDPHYTGMNEAWGIAATTFLKDQFFPNCDRKGRYDWKTLLYLSGIAWDRDGDDLMILTEDDNGSGFPKVEIIPAARIGTGWLGVVERTVKGGRFDGMEIYDGIIFNRGKPVGVRVLGVAYPQTPSAPDYYTYQDFSLGFGGNADLAVQPEWQDQGRGIPLIGRVCPDWMDLQDIDSFLKAGIKRAASIGLKTKTAEGEAATGNEVVTEEEETTITNDGATTTEETNTISYEEIQGGEMYYLSAANGEEIEALSYENPHSNVEAFIARIERRGIRAVGWFYELIYLSESGRAATRLVANGGNKSIWKQQSLGYRRTFRAARYALAKGMKNGFIPNNPDPMDAYFSWEFGLPEEISVDAGNDEQADRENLKMGTTSKAILAQKKGRYHKEIARQRKSEILDTAADALEIEQKTSGKISFDKALELLEQRSPNPNQVTPPKGTANPNPAPGNSK